MQQLAESIYRLHQEYQELADMIPLDHPGSRLLPRLNTELQKLSIELLCKVDDQGKAASPAGTDSLLRSEGDDSK